MTRVILVAKVILDGSAGLSFAVIRSWPMAFMFIGFTIADAGALWLA